LKDKDNSGRLTEYRKWFLWHFMTAKILQR